MLEPIFKRIPEELTEYDHWVVWKAEHRNGKLKPTKVPYDAKTGNHARVNDPTTWCNFKTAKAAYEDGDYTGVGFVLTKNDPYIGIDLDDCFVGDELILGAKDVNKSLNSYTEKSPSGKGLDIYKRQIARERL